VSAQITTVQGDLDPSDVGFTLMHEHLFVDVTMFWEESAALPDGDTRAMSAELGGPARWNASIVRDNLRLEPERDAGIIEAEVDDFAAAVGAGACIVDVSSRPLGPFPKQLRSLSERTGVHIVASTGFYVGEAHPEWVRSASISELEQFMLAEVREGIAGTDVRAGIIGEIGTSAVLEEAERRVLTAAARVARATGVALNIHCEPPPLAVAHEILDVVESQGAAPGRVYLSHLDEVADNAYLIEILNRGVVVGFDSFGQEGYFSPTWAVRRDNDKAASLAAMIDAGFVDQLVVAQDVCKKSHLKPFGGMGLDHVPRRVVPRLRESFGVSDDALEAITHRNPVRLLAVAS
jgi:phosphotriesterase-related protein